MKIRPLALVALFAVGCARCTGTQAPADSMPNDSASSGDSTGANDSGAHDAAAPDAATAALTVTSSAFAEGASIPPAHANLNCGAGAANTSPALAWTGAPAGTRSFALIMDDPDAPGGTFTHWIAWNLPASTTMLPAGVTTTISSFVQGRNDFGEGGYGGPCPPAPTGEHRYVFRVYALSVESLSIPPNSSVAALRAALEGVVLAEGSLTGRYRQ